MRNWRRGLLPGAALLVFVLGFSLLTSNKILADGEEPVSEDQAVKIAAGLLGIDTETDYSAKLDKVTDNTGPFIKVVDLPAWTITFEGVEVTFPGAEQPKPEFSTLTCLVDARTGALLKVSSPVPTAGAVYNETHPGALVEEMGNKTLTPIAASRLPDAGVKPLIPLLPELEKLRKRNIQPAKQLVAYIGLYTDNLPASKFVEHPCWLINTGGVKTASGSDVLTYVDATTGKVFMRRYIEVPGVDDQNGYPPAPG